MTSTDHRDSDRALDSILADAENAELDRLQAGLNLDAGLAAIVHDNPAEQADPTDATDSGEPRIITDSGHQRRTLAPLSAPWRAQPCVLLAVDAAGFSGHVRDDMAQMMIREALYTLLPQAFEKSHLRWDDCYREDRGDGFLVVMPAETPSADVIGPLLGLLRAGLRRHNRMSADSTRIRLRVALHVGNVHRDDHGLVGSALIHLFRLLDAPVLKKSLARSSGDMALIVSDYLYESVIRHGPGLIDPATYRQVAVAVKETRARGWLHVAVDESGSPELDAAFDSPLGTRTEATDSPVAQQTLAGVPSTAEILPFRWEG